MKLIFFIKKIHEQNQFQEEKNQFKSFTKRKIDMQQVSREKSARSNFHEQNQHATSSIDKTVLRGEKSTHNFQKAKNKHATNCIN